MKNLENLENEGDQKKLIEEFDKKVSMLDKFRSIYVINFVGAVYVVKHIAIVTELAEHGSIRDLIAKRKENPLSNSMKVMLMFLDDPKSVNFALTVPDSSKLMTKKLSGLISLCKIPFK